MKPIQKYIFLPLCFLGLVACSESPNASPADVGAGAGAGASQTSSADASDAEVSEDNYFVAAEESSTPIVPSQYRADGLKMAPLSVCGVNGSELDQEMSRFERENPNYRPKSDPELRIVQNGMGNVIGLEPGSDVFIARNEAMNKAVLNAKAAIIKTINQRISATQAVHSPPSGLSIDEKVDAQTEGLRRQFASLAAETQELGREYRALSEAVIVSDEDELKGITTQDRVNSFFDAAIQKLDESYDPATISEDKLARVTELKERLQSTRAEFLSHSNQLQDLERDLESAANQSIAKTTVEAAAQMPLYGASMVIHMECYDAEERSVYARVKMIWTPGEHEKARAILLNEAVELSPGDMSFDDYIYSLDLSQKLGSYRYIDDEGTPWFYSIRSADYTAGMPENIRGRTDLFAQGQVALMLQSEVMTHARAEEAIAQNEGARSAVTASQFMSEMSAEARDLNLYGLNIARQDVVESPITQGPAHVSVAAINMKAAHNAPEAMASLYATLKEVNADQSYREGLRQGMIDSAESTRNDPAARQQGYVDGGEAVDEVVAESQSPADEAMEGELIVGEDGELVAPENTEQSVKFKSKAKKDDF